MTDSRTVKQRLEDARRDLLDLSLRNTLLNFRELSSSGVRIIDERSSEVFRILVGEGRAMSFLSAPEPKKNDERDPEQLYLSTVFSQPEEDSEESDDRHVDDKLQTPYSDAKLQRRLLNTYYKAKTHIEERGVNVLFLALGTLHWYEDAGSKSEHLAPLILVPVELYRTNVRARFKVRYTGAGVGSNRCLEVKLKLENGVDLPKLSEDEAIDVPGFLAGVSSALGELAKWQVSVDAIHLGFFSFAKLLMYEDLDSERWPSENKPHDHPLLSRVLGEGFRDEGLGPPADTSLDTVLGPEDIFQVLDADSSQTEAIATALAGQSMVIQGPPGTGKSQTITNLMAEAVMAGKKVLFVAEKMAALEVVKRRLVNHGLGDLVLELHSHNVNKKQVLEEIGRTLSLNEPSGEDRGLQAANAKQARDRLNAYARAVNAPIAPSGVSPFRAYGRFLVASRTLQKLQPPRIAYSGFERWSDEECNRRLAHINDLQGALARMGRPTDHPFWGSEAEVFVPTLDRGPVSESAGTALKRLLDFQMIVQSIAEFLQLPEPDSLDQADRYLSFLQSVMRLPNLGGIRVETSEWTAKSPEIQRAIGLGARIAVTRAEQGPRLMAEAWGRDVTSLKEMTAFYGGKWWRFLSSPYRRCRRELSGFWNGSLPSDHQVVLKALDAILLVEKLQTDLRQLDGLLASLFGDRGTAVDRDWAELSRISSFLQQTHEAVARHALPAQALAVLQRDATSHRGVAQLVEKASASRQALGDALQEALRTSKFPENVEISSWPFSILQPKLKGWHQSPARLHEMAVFNRESRELSALGLETLVRAAESWPEAASGLTDLFNQCRSAALIEAALRQRPEIAVFDGVRHASAIDRFRTADRKLIESNRIAIAHAHWEGLPDLVGAGQVGVLRHELQKKSRHRPIRQLMSDAGRAVQAAKPVFMMSPLSVAAFLPPDSVEFDLVLFDEASQVRPVDAFGALLRARQAVVVGDSKQLPPTAFFERRLEEEFDQDEETQDQTSDLESVLGLFLAKGAPQRMLRWHYRSRHESLIAVSNREFYDGGLMIFPSPDAEKEDLGLVFHHLPNCHYERGTGRSYNRDEAKVVAKAVMRHAKLCAHLSLGVAAFSQAQMQVILDEVELARRQDPSREDFFSSHPDEPFFVKNLENVQGDERDVIFISVGYGRTKEGFLAMSFGPLNRDGGERRLNVLITRARRRCEVFSNLKAQDIDISRARGPGVVALKRYLNYAELGSLDVPASPSNEAQSPFETEVARSLIGYGYTVDLQVGSAGFFIDLAVRDPAAPGRYLLGIECDGASYHSSRWARDRDRLRQEVLEGLGWKLHRIWSTDWFRDPDSELRRCLEAIEDCISGATGVQSTTASTSFQVPRKEVASIDHSQLGDLAEPVFTPYELASLTLGQQSPQDFAALPESHLAEKVKQVVDVEAPVHVDEVMSRIANAVGILRVGSRIRQTLDRAVTAAVRSGLIRRGKDDFLWRAASNEVKPRNRADLPNASRNFDVISSAEIQAAIVAEVERSHGIAVSAVAQVVCRRFGFGRSTENMQRRVNRVLAATIEIARLVERNGMVLLPAEPDGSGGPGASRRSPV
jgi:very-short-patch-repair endonuclease